MKEFGGSLSLHLIVWNIISALIGIIVFIIPDFISIIGWLFINIPLHNHPIWTNITFGLLVGEFLFFIIVRKTVKKEYPYL